MDISLNIPAQAKDLKQSVVAWQEMSLVLLPLRSPQAIIFRLIHP